MCEHKIGINVMCAVDRQTVYHCRYHKSNSRFILHYCNNFRRERKKIAESFLSAGKVWQIVCANCLFCDHQFQIKKITVKMTTASSASSSKLYYTYELPEDVLNAVCFCLEENNGWQIAAKEMGYKEVDFFVSYKLFYNFLSIHGN